MIQITVNKEESNPGAAIGPHPQPKSKMNKYSTSVNPEAMYFLMNNGIAFVCRRGEHDQKFRLFFIADGETVEALREQTGSPLYDENDDWNFTEWDAISRRPQR
jgi:hypothetical protein